MDYLLEHLGHKGSAFFDPIGGRHYGTLLNIPDRVAYESSSAEGLIANFEAAVEEYIHFHGHLLDEHGEEMVDHAEISIFVRCNSAAA